MLSFSILAFVVGILGKIEAGVIKDAVNEACKTPRIEFLQNGTQLWKITVDQEKSLGASQLFLNDSVVNFDIDDKNKRIFWHDSNGSFYTRHIESDAKNATFVLDYSQLMKNFYTPEEGKSCLPFSYDKFTNKLYVSDNKLRKVVIVDLNTKSLAFISDWSPILTEAIKDSEAMIGIVVIPDEGLMFLQLGYQNSTQKVFQSEMDGTNTTEIDLCTCEEVEESYAKKFPEKFCNNTKPVVLDHVFQDVRSIKSLESDDLGDTKNSCATDNGGCEHFCLPKTFGGHGCACPYGWKPSTEDTKKCESSRTKRQGPKPYEHQTFPSYQYSTNKPQQESFFNIGNQVPSWIIFG